MQRPTNYTRMVTDFVAGVLVGVLALYALLQPSQAALETWITDAEDQAALQQVIREQAAALDRAAGERRALAARLERVRRRHQDELDSLQRAYRWTIYRQDQEIRQLERFISRNYRARVMPPETPPLDSLFMHRTER